MKKVFLCTFCLMLLLLLTACTAAPSGGTVTPNVTWDELLAANQLEAVLAQGGLCSATKDDDGTVYMSYAAMKDGELMHSNGPEGHTSDLRGGIIYNAFEEDKSITIIAPTADLKDLFDENFGEELSSYHTPEKVYATEDQYYVKLYQKDEEWGAVTEGYAYFDAKTLLLDRIDLTLKLGAYQIKQSVSMSYNVGTDFAMSSYDQVVNAKDMVNLTIHYPDGTTKDITVDRNVDISAYYPDHLEQWSVCWDEACTGRVDDLGWITGNHGDVYLFNGDVPSAPPELRRVLDKSSFETMFRDNYDTYFQRIDVMDKDENVTQVTELAWYMEDDAGLCLNFEVKDADYQVICSARARDNAWYSWSKGDGYAVDFYDEFSYAEELISAYRVFLPENRLVAPMEQLDEYGPYSIPYREIRADGTSSEYRYWIHPDSDYIDWIAIIHKDSDGNIVGHETCYLGGNGPIPGEMDIYQEISAPGNGQTVKLTVVSPVGEQTYAVRKDASISWKGEALYSDEACANAVLDLKWVDGREAKVYVK